MSDTLGRHECGIPISSDSIESLFGVAKRHGTGEIKDANRIALRIPALCGVPTRQDAENVLRISVKEQQQVDTLPSLIKQRRDVLKQDGCLEAINQDDARENVELILGSKSGQNYLNNTYNTVTYENINGP